MKGVSKGLEITGPEGIATLDDKAIVDMKANEDEGAVGVFVDEEAAVIDGLVEAEFGVKFNVAVEEETATFHTTIECAEEGHARAGSAFAMREGAVGETVKGGIPAESITGGVADVNGAFHLGSEVGLFDVGDVSASTRAVEDGAEEKSESDRTGDRCCGIKACKADVALKIAHHGEASFDLVDVTDGVRFDAVDPEEANDGDVGGTGLGWTTNR